jgi:hypothetical protein
VSSTSGSRSAGALASVYQALFKKGDDRLLNGYFCDLPAEWPLRYQHAARYSHEHRDLTPLRLWQVQLDRCIAWRWRSRGFSDRRRGLHKAPWIRVLSSSATRGGLGYSQSHLKFRAVCNADLDPKQDSCNLQMNCCSVSNRCSTPSD